LVSSAHQAETLQAAEHGIAPLTTTRRALDAWVTGAGETRPVRIVGRDTDHQSGECRMVEETIEGMFDDAAPGDLQVLLGAIGAHPAANTCCRNHHPECRLAHSISW